MQPEAPGAAVFLSRCACARAADRASEVPARAERAFRKVERLVVEFGRGLLMVSRAVSVWFG
jgi:hypothetical protein